jgi:hypothetical protein
MPVVKPLGFGGIDAFNSGEVMAGIHQTGKMDYSNGYGFAVCGSSRYGDHRLQGGIYQKRVTGYNHTGRIPGRPRKVYYVKMRSYAPTQRDTPAQLATKNNFRAARAAWGALDDAEKTKWQRKAARHGRLGWRLFMSEYLRGNL